MAKNMELVCRMRKLSAVEYMKFLERHDVECFGLGIAFDENIAIYADEAKYLQLSIEDNKFNSNEKQLLNLLQLIEKIVEDTAKNGVDQNNKTIDEKQEFDEDED